MYASWVGRVVHGRSRPARRTPRRHSSASCGFVRRFRGQLRSARSSAARSVGSPCAGSTISTGTFEQRLRSSITCSRVTPCCSTSCGPRSRGRSRPAIPGDDRTRALDPGRGRRATARGTPRADREPVDRLEEHGSPATSRAAHARSDCARRPDSSSPRQRGRASTAEIQRGCSGVGVETGAPRASELALRLQRFVDGRRSESPRGVRGRRRGSGDFIRHARRSEAQASEFWRADGVSW